MSMLPSFLSSFFGENGDPRTAKEPNTKKTTFRGSVQQAGLLDYAFSGMQGWRMTMEDAHMVCTEIPVLGQDKPLTLSKVSSQTLL